MTTTSLLHPLARDYLDRLRRAASRVPRGRRDELVAEVEAHLAEAIPPEASDVDALNVLERLGPPEAIVEAESPAAAPAPGAVRGPRETAAIILLLFGGFFAGIGWFVGLVFLWSSKVWTDREKWIGTFVVPGGLALPFYVYLATADLIFCSESPSGREVCTGGDTGASAVVEPAIALGLALGAVGAAVFLARRARRRSAAA